jgi:uncharacterized protein (DUF983 family)
MSNYLPLKPLGEGSAQIEHFHSFFYRYAALHTTTMIPMAKHLQEWWNESHTEQVALNEVFLYKANRLPLCGYGRVVESYVRVVSQAAHCSNLYRTTLIPIRDASDSIAHGALRRGRAWCPACMYWAERNHDVYYDRLIWALAATGRCCEHQFALVNTCPRCGIQQLAYHSTAGMTRCAKCLASLVQAPNAWVPMDKPSFGEKDCLELINAIASGGLRGSVPGAFGLFVREARSLANPLLAYKPDPSLKGGARTWRATKQKPTLLTMLKRCHRSGVKLIDVLSDPLGAAHTAGLLLAENLELPISWKPRRTEEIIREVKACLIDAVANFPERPLIPFAEFARNLCVSKGFLLYSRLYARSTSRNTRDSFVKKIRGASATRKLN